MLYATIGLVAFGLIAIAWCMWAKFEQDRAEALEIKKIRFLHMKTNTMIEPPLHTSLNDDNLEESRVNEKLLIN